MTHTSQKWAPQKWANHQRAHHKQLWFFFIVLVLVLLVPHMAGCADRPSLRQHYYDDNPMRNRAEIPDAAVPKASVPQTVTPKASIPKRGTPQNFDARPGGMREA